MRKPKKGWRYIEVCGADGTVRVSVDPAKLTALGGIALRMAAECAVLLANQSAEPCKAGNKAAQQLLDDTAPRPGAGEGER